MARDGSHLLQHESLWAAIDDIATMFGLTPSGLARHAGLDATVFNKSKRRGSDGRPRWPSTESIAKVLDATGLGVPALLMVAGGAARAYRCPDEDVAPDSLLAGFAEESRIAFRGVGEALTIPLRLDAPLIAVEVTDDTAMPLYRPGDRLIASLAAKIAPGDRIVLSTADGGMLIRTLRLRTRRTLQVAPLNDGAAEERLRASEVAWVARILWASQ